MRPIALYCMALGIVGCAAAPVDQQPIDQQQSAIVSGTPSSGDLAVVRLRSNGRTFCTATIASPRAVITAAHCLRDFVADDIALDDGRSIAIERTLVHPEFDEANLRNDVAVVLLAESVDPAHVAGVLSESLLGMERATLRIVGFGAGSGSIKTGGAASLDRLDPLTFTVKADPALPCAGDSGGPAFLRVGDRDFLVGVVSSGDVACRDHGTYSRIDVYRPWLDEQLDQASDTAETEANGCRIARRAGAPSRSSWLALVLLAIVAATRSPRGARARRRE